jgi:hypothetical protein
MSARLFDRSAAAAFALSWALMAPVLAQNIQDGSKSTGSKSTTSTAANDIETGPQAGQTGAGERGTKVAPSTTPGQPSQPMTADTGVEPRGTKVAPSTDPTQGGQEKQ